MKLAAIALIFFPLSCLQLNGQADRVIMHSWPGASDLIAAEPTGSLYIVREGILTRFSENGDSLFTWTDPASGAITWIDVSDPLRILVYQKDFNLLRFLNNRLAPLSDPVRLDQLGIPEPMALATSRQGGFWVLDGTTLRLCRYDHQLHRQTESSPLDIQEPASRNVIRLFESSGRLWLHLPGSEIRQFDLFGNLVRRIPLKVQSISPFGDQLLLVRPGGVSLFADPFLPESPLLQWPESTLLDACLQKDCWLVRTSREVLLLRR